MGANKLGVGGEEIMAHISMMEECMDNEELWPRKDEQKRITFGIIRIGNSLLTALSINCSGKLSNGNKRRYNDATNNHECNLVHAGVGMRLRRHRGGADAPSRGVLRRRTCVRLICLKESA